MPEHFDLILTFTGGLAAALFFGYLTTRIHLSPIVGYLIAGIAVSHHTPGFEADEGLASQMAEIGVILLMFGVGLQFHLKELLAVRRVAIPGALVQIAAATALGAVVTHLFGWSWNAGLFFGLAISVASTVVLTRVLADHGALHTRTGHIAIGWLVVEDLFTVVALVVLPMLVGSSSGGLAGALGVALLKLAALVALTFVLGGYAIPRLLAYVARTGSRELFTLTILVLALGIAVGAAKLFGASMALGAFLAGMVVGQSEFSNRAATEALPFRDAFAVLFFVSVGMLFDPNRLAQDWPLIALTTCIIVAGKPLAALLVVRVLRYPFAVSLGVAVALAQIGEFSFILATLGSTMGVLPAGALNVLVASSILSITLNPLLYRATPAVIRWVGSHPALSRWLDPAESLPAEPHHATGEDEHHAIVVGYGPVGRTVKRILASNGIRPIIVEMNVDTVRSLRASGVSAVYGEAARRETLEAASVATAEALIFTASSVAHVGEAIRIARQINPDINVLARANYLNEAPALDRAGATRIVTAEGEVALTMTEFLLRSLGATFEQVDRERERVRRELFGD
ncbi:MAG: cation:proton antiporter [Terrimicrobiaceae bacterium]|nr:cation:proton antiporter [Terrimicrobiaceae bacterium]